MPNLFVETPRFEKTATVKLSEDSAQWPLEIVQHLHEEHPYLAETSADIVFKKQDKVRGYGYGFLKVGDEIRVPIIIRQYEMSPLDVYLDNKGKTHALTEDSIKSATMGIGIGKAVKPQTAGYVDSLIYSRTYPPYDGKYVYASADKTGETAIIRAREYGSALSALGMNQEEKKACIESMSPEAVAGMKVNGTYDVLTKWAADKPMRAKAADYMRHKSPRLPDADIKDDLPVGDVQVADKFGIYLCEGTKSGQKYKGHVFPHVFDFDLNRMSITIFTGRWMPTDKNDHGRSASAVQAQIAGQLLPETDKIWDDCGRGGDRGFFVTEKGGAAVALPPVKIISTSTTREHHETNKKTENDMKRVRIETDYEIKKYYCQTDLGQPVTIICTPHANNVVRVGNDVHVPANMKFVRLHETVTLKSDPEMVKKAAQEALGVRELQVRHYGRLFAFQGYGVDDYNLEAGVFEPAAREFLEKTWTKEASQKILDSSKDKGEGSTIHVAVPKIPMEKVAAETVSPAKKQAVSNRIQALAHGFDKIAATLEDSGLVDNVLSLKFLTKENINKYAEFIPQFEEATTHLADLLVASRIGLQIDQGAVKVAMENMAEIVNQLKTIKGR